MLSKEEKIVEIIDCATKEEKINMLTNYLRTMKSRHIEYLYMLKDIHDEEKVV